MTGIAPSFSSRQSTVLRLVIWPHLFTRRPISTSSTASTSAATGSQTGAGVPPPTWSPVVRERVSRDPALAALFPELLKPPNSDARSRTRGYLGIEDVDKLSPAAESSATALLRVIKCHQKPGDSFEGKRCCWEEAGISAHGTLSGPKRETKSTNQRRDLRRRARSETPIHGTLEPLATVPASSNKIIDTPATSPQKHIDLARVQPHPPRPLPPSVHRLLTSRLYRMAVFSIISTPEYCSDATLLERVASILEREGAGKLATRLRRGAELSRVDKGKVRLFSDPSPLAVRNPPDHWKMPPVPPPSPLADQQRRLTQYYNMHLTHLLVHPSSPFPLQNPTTTKTQIVGPSESLAQLRHLLKTIDKLERHRGFRPDEVTGNIIIKCLMRCSFGLASDRNRSGSRRKTPDNHFGIREIRAVFELVARTVEASGTVDYRLHIRPFAKTLATALENRHDGEGKRLVVAWMKKMKKRQEQREKESKE
ncbi:hypothetical protein P7C73_g61, partial [Tremellales sp. Uapishka_1]